MLGVECMVKLRKVACIALCFATVLSLGACNNADNIDDTEATNDGIELSENEVLATLPDGYYYGADGNIYDADGNIADGAIFEGSNAGLDQNNLSTWHTISGAIVTLDESKIARYEIPEGYENNLGVYEFGYKVFENENIKIFLNNFIRGYGGLNLSVNASNNGISYFYVEITDGSDAVVEVVEYKLNDELSDFISTSTVGGGSGYISLPWVSSRDSDTATTYTYIGINLKITIGETVIDTGLLDLTEFVNDLSRLAPATSDNIIKVDDADANKSDNTSTETSNTGGDEITTETDTNTDAGANTDAEALDIAE